MVEHTILHTWDKGFVSYISRLGKVYDVLEYSFLNLKASVWQMMTGKCMFISLLPQLAF